MWKKVLKRFNLSENYLSMILGFFVVLVLGFFVVNIFKKQPAEEKPGETSSTSTTEETAEESKGERTYTVQKGENLWQISEKNYQSGYNWIDIAKANNLTNPDHVEEGQVLKIPDVTPILPETGVAEKQEETPSVPETYTVSASETLWAIAVKVYNNGYKWVEIAKLNNLHNPDLIHAGNVLNLPR